MRKFILHFLACFFFSVISAFGQTNPWKTVKARNVASEQQLLTRPNLPRNYKVLNLDANELKSATSQTQLQTSNAKRAAGIQVSMPTPDGDFIDFEIFEQYDLEPELAMKFPNLKSYTGYSVTNRATEINFTVNALGFNAIITSPDFSTIYIDSYSKDLNQYIIYYKDDLAPVKEMFCLDNTEVTTSEDPAKPRQFSRRQSDGVYRKYRIAIATTVEYSNFHIERVGAQNKTIQEKKEVVLSAIQTSINRVNSIYKRDLAIHLTLVANNDAIIFINTDNFDNTNANVLIGQSQTVINSVIGDANYDIGHTFSTGAGGLATLYTPCSNFKARGVTGSTQPINDPYDIDFVSHEIGHQFGATHTFNNYCGDNRTDETAFEPGSGSTIMAYAGVCAPNILENSDDYFHYISIEQIQNFVTTAGTCSDNTILNNTAPVINTLPNYVIPKGTAFKLSADVTDQEQDLLTYGWEQLDNGIAPYPLEPTATRGPLFRSIKPNSSSTRYFPNYESVLNGNLVTQWEVIPTVARVLNFGLTVRDNNINGGQTAQKETQITVANVGPFVITSPNNETASWPKGSNQQITWDVAGTTANGINVNTVNILLSTDGGQTYEVIKENTPNDGSEAILAPEVLTKDARIMIEANNHIFYTVSKKFSIGYQLIVEENCKDYTLAYNGSNIANTGVFYSFPFNVNETDNFDIKKIKLNTNIIADRTADVNVYFKNADETATYSTIVFRNLACSSTQNLNASFENSGTAIDCGLINTSTILKPVEMFTAINKKANGQWVVYVSKNSANNTVKVNKLVLTLCGEKRTYLEIGANVKTDPFAVFPNPSHGEFKFYLDSERDVNVSIFDLTGKLIMHKTYDASDVNIRNINLAMLAKGVYILKVDDGKIKESKKIIIN